MNKHSLTILLAVLIFQNNFCSAQKINRQEVYGGNFYGTFKSEVDRIWLQNKVVIFDVDVEGGLNIKKYFGDKAIAIFVKPPNIQVLEMRLRDRSTETEETLKIRVEKAVHELTFENKFEKVIENDKLDEALIEAEKMINDFLN